MRRRGRQLLSRREPSHIFSEKASGAAQRGDFYYLCTSSCPSLIRFNYPVRSRNTSSSEMREHETRQRTTKTKNVREHKTHQRTRNSCQRTRNASAFNEHEKRQRSRETRQRTRNASAYNEHGKCQRTTTIRTGIFSRDIVYFIYQ